MTPVPPLTPLFLNDRTADVVVYKNNIQNTTKPGSLDTVQSKRQPYGFLTVARSSGLSVVIKAEQTTGCIISRQVL